MKSEKEAILLSAFIALLVGVLGITFSMLSNSGAILLDGVFNLSFFVTAIFTLRIVKIINRPDDENFPFGYGYFEALINAVKGLLILGVSLIAFFDALVAIFTTGRVIVAGPAIIYASIASTLCIFVTVILFRSYKFNKSPLVRADYQNWTVNSVISATILFAFVITWLLQKNNWTMILAYIDPVLTALVVCFSIGIPVRMAWNALMALLNRTPSLDAKKNLETAIYAALNNLSLKKVYVRMIQPGRTPYVLVHVLVPEDNSRLTIESMDSYRNLILKSVLTIYKTIVIDIVFTAQDKFAEPTAGFSNLP